MNRFPFVLLWLWLTAILTTPVQASPDKSTATPIDRQPYAIKIHLVFDTATRVDADRRAQVLDEWSGLVRRFVGAPWQPQVVPESNTLAAIPIENLKADAFTDMGVGVDKVWAIQVNRLGPGFELKGREFDVSTGWLGEVHRLEVPVPANLARSLFQLTLTLFAPTADVGESKSGGVFFLVRGASLPAASPLGEVASAGTIFRVIRLFLKPDDSVQEVRDVPYSYFRVERLDGPNAFCEIIKGVGDPLTNRYARKNRLVALGIKAASAPTRLRFILKGDRQPAAGYKLTARSVAPGAKANEVGTTDREGRIVLPSGYADSLVMLRLLAGNDEPMADIPAMPGETLEERTIIFEPRPLTLALEAKLDALRDAIIDIVTVRARLEARMKARLDGEDWPGLDESIKEFRKLTPRDQFDSQLTKIRERAELQEAELKTLILTRNARAALNETKGLIDRYLDDETIKAYEDAAERAKAELAKPKAKGKAAASPKPKSP